MVGGFALIETNINITYVIFVVEVVGKAFRTAAFPVFAGPAWGVGWLVQAQRPFEEGLSPSAKYVLRVLRELGEARFSELFLETGLPRRTLYAALRALRERGLVVVRPCLNDARRRFYCYSVKSDG